mgnify:CR=1 FL=1
MDSTKQKINHAYEMLSGVQLEGKYAKRFGKAMQDLEEAYVETEKAERELITLRKELSEKKNPEEKENPEESEVADG